MRLIMISSEVNVVRKEKSEPWGPLGLRDMKTKMIHIGWN